MRFVFGKRLFYLLYLDSINNTIHAELELLQNKNDLLNDFISIIVKHSKTLEYEIYSFAKKVLLRAYTKDIGLSKIEELKNEILGYRRHELVKRYFNPQGSFNERIR